MEANDYSRRGEGGLRRYLLLLTLCVGLRVGNGLPAKTSAAKER